MPTLIQPVDALADYLGLRELTQYANEDGQFRRTNCGQAAAATMLHHLDSSSGTDLMAWLEKEHPPDNLGGWLGTSRRRIERALRARGRRPRTVEGLDRLRATLTRGAPILVVLQLSAGRIWRFNLPGAHWMVAFGFDREHIYLTNQPHNRMTWEEFLPGWHGWVPALTGMRRRGLIVT